IVAHLRAKQITEDAIAQALEMIDTSGDVETLVSLMRKRAGTLKSKEPRLARASLMRFAAARGYRMDQAMAALERIGSNYMDADLD
ncbi:MAG: RecX family transcriptional regulator, partial [Muribaculaceae bacterium]|nr:RecX family transcriptional regulator [Muribaculaceae bacterium]